MSHSRSAVILFSVLLITMITVQIPTVHAPPPPLTYVLTLSASRIQEANTPGVTMTLNVSNTTPGQILGFSWNVTDPSGGLSSFFSGASANGPFLILSAVYPRDFSGTSIKYNGTYRINVFQTYPQSNPPPLVATGKFYVGLTDSLSYRRTSQVSILAQGYASGENITIRISQAGMPASGFPRTQLANGNGVLSYLWSIPLSAPLGSYNVSLTGQMTVKKPPDSQLFTVLQTTISVSQLAINMTLLQGFQLATFSFTGTYPNGNQAKTGAATLRVIEPDGITAHQASVSYNSTLGAFEGTYRIDSSSPSGGWVAILDPNTFDDGYGNVGPSMSVLRGFVVEPANSQTLVTDLLLIAVILLAAALVMFVSWALFFGGRKKIQRSVLKVDFQSIEREAARVENRDFFAKVHDQLQQQQQRKLKPDEGSKDG